MLGATRVPRAPGSAGTPTAPCTVRARTGNPAVRARVTQRFQFLLDRIKMLDILGHVDQAGYTLKIADVALSCGDIAGHRLERSLRPGVPREQDLSVGRCRQRRVYLDLYFGHVGVVVIHRLNTLHFKRPIPKQTEVGGEQFTLAPQVFRLPGAGQLLTLGFQLAPIPLKPRAYLASQRLATFLQLLPLLSTGVTRIDHV